MTEARSGGPLTGLRVVELAGMGPVPHAAMLLGDLGAEVVRVERPRTKVDGDVLLRNRSRIQLDLTTMSGGETLRALVRRADVLIEGYRPGVMERLGVGPDECLSLNPKLIYGRMTGWGQSGPLAKRAGHDINYIALTGVLHATGPASLPPPPPLNVIGDFGGGSMFLLVGVLSALWERAHSGLGQVIDAAMVDGVGILSQMMWSFLGQGKWSDQRESNLLDGGAPYYRTYKCADGRYIAVGAIEPPFYEQMLRGLGVSESDEFKRRERQNWPQLQKKFEQIFASRTRDEWANIFADTDACVTPVLTFAEAALHAHALERRAFTSVEGIVQAMPAPRFGRSRCLFPTAPVDELVEPADLLQRWDPQPARGS
jgi:alpha-methylacyl-CoA racemase